ncbi:DUF2975 domain-containing protein [Qipengyuania sp. 6B39]|uniref:DUF2975 domain-containing protein n=1 Tax=Qipengyuania proteolytica TaxID=2867239 RepID=UPI001C8AEA20|nr:DUF2975 domain-containing protein [Qipengyuania proteolytica]MBX7494356.1 DUF2975 domain-containing protein [Qipengyuania proteolytica]
MTTAQHFRDPLLLAGQALTVLLQILMTIAGIGFLVAIPALVLFHDRIVAELANNLGPQAADLPVYPMVGVMALALVAVILIFLFFENLRRIIGTVGAGDPFAPDNAARLGVMAWLLLAVQLIDIPIAAIGASVSDWVADLGEGSLIFTSDVDFTGFLMVIVLFILARVFKLGAAMRDDLEGTV